MSQEPDPRPAETTPAEPSDAPPERRDASGRRRQLWTVVLAVLVLGVAYGGFRVWNAVRAGTAGRGALIRAEAELAAHQPGPARVHLLAAQADFKRISDELESLGPLHWLLKSVPLVRQQVRGAKAFSEAGLLLTEAGLRLDDAAAGVVDPEDEHVEVSAAIESIRHVREAVKAGIVSLDRAIARVRSVDDYNLLGPLGRARDDLASRLPAARRKAESADAGLGALIDFAGGSGLKRYLLLSQNPDEPRPTGGFIGTYGVLVADGSQIRLERYDAIESWTRPRPEAVVAAQQAGIVFQVQGPPANQTLGNVNTTPDWPAAARLAMHLWEKGGEAPVDGVVSFTPGLLQRILEVTGPVSVPIYSDTVDSKNFYDRLDFHTHSDEAVANPDRKDFVAALAEATLQRLLAAPARVWDPLASAVSGALDNQQVMVWSRDPAVATEVSKRRWDAAIPQTSGDFFVPSEFSFVAKNGRIIRRTYDHHVALRPDGSARITTTITVQNTQPRSNSNPDSLSYITLYGPTGAVIAEGADPEAYPEKELAGHPAYAWFRAAEPLGQAKLTIVWEAPDIVPLSPDGSSVYALWWKRVVDHPGDLLRLKVDLPPGWRWKDAGPPAEMELEGDVVQAWPIRRT